MRIGFPSRVSQDLREHTLLAQAETHPLSLAMVHSLTQCARVPSPRSAKIEETWTPQMLQRGWPAEAGCFGTGEGCALFRAAQGQGQRAGTSRHLVPCPGYPEVRAAGLSLQEGIYRMSDGFPKTVAILPRKGIYSIILYYIFIGCAVVPWCLRMKLSSKCSAPQGSPSK